MHVQWVQELDASAGTGGRPCLVAILVMGPGSDGDGAETALGSVQLRYLQTRITCTRDFHQGLFWKKVEQNLDSLLLEPGIRRNIEKQITEKVPRPSPDWALWGVTCIPRFDRR